MNKFKKILFSIMIVLIFNTVIVLFLLHNSQKFFFEGFSFFTPFIVQINNFDLKYKIYDNEKTINNFKLEDIYSYFLKCMYLLYHYFNVFLKFLNVISLDVIKEKIHTVKEILINKIMHQSCDVLNSDVILNTTTILELELRNDHVYWIIQLGAFKNFQRILKIVDELQRDNYPIYVLPRNPRGGDLVRVFVGPYSSKENLEYVLNDLYRITKLYGRIYVYRGGGMRDTGEN